MRVTPAELSSALTYIGEQLEGELRDDVLKKLSMDAYRGLVRRTAVKTGFLRSQWAVAIDTNPPSAIVKPEEKGKKYSRPTYNADSRIKWGSTVHIYNNTAYAKYLEDGTPRMAAQPMVAPVYASLQSQVNSLIREINTRKLR